MTLAQGSIGKIAQRGGAPAVDVEYDAVIATPLPQLKLGVLLRNDALYSVDFLDGDVSDTSLHSTAAQHVAAQLHAYFVDPRRPLNVLMALGGTDFQQRVWSALRAIPVGETRRYGDFARALKSSARAVGGACRANPVPLFVPCHRVVAASGDGGFMGHTDGAALALKRWLLQHERARP